MTLLDIVFVFLFRSEFFFRTTQELEYLFFLSREFFFQNLTLGDMIITLAINFLIHILLLYFQKRFVFSIRQTMSFHSFSSNRSINHPMRVHQTTYQ